MTENPRVFTARHHVPLSGYAAGTFATHAVNAPPFLRGPFGETASLISSSLPTMTPGELPVNVYRFDTFAQNWNAAPDVAVFAGSNLDPDGMILLENQVDSREVDIPWLEVPRPTLAFSAHPATLDLLGELGRATLVIDGEGAESMRFVGQPEKVLDTPSLQRFRLRWKGVRHAGVALVDVPARAPWTHWHVLVRRYDAQAGGSARIVWAWATVELGTVDFACLTARSFIVSSIRPGAEIDDNTKLALRNAGMWRGMPVKINDGDLVLGMPCVKPPRNVVLAAMDLTAGIGRVNPNNAGADAIFGPTAMHFLVDETGDCMPHRLGYLIDAAKSWARRPAHWTEPNTDDVLRVVPTRPLTLWSGQPFDRREADSLLIGAQYRGATRAGLWSFDNEHQSCAKLAYALAFTAHPLLHEIARSYFATLLYDRSILNGWPAPGRGQGNPGIAIELLRRVVQDNHMLDAYADHQAERKRLYLEKRLTGPRVCVGGLYERGSSWVVRGTIQGATSNPNTRLVDIVHVEGQEIREGDVLVVTDVQGNARRFTVLSAGAATISTSPPVPDDLEDRPFECVGLYWDGYEQATIADWLWMAGEVDLAFEHGRGLLCSAYVVPDAPERMASAYNVRWIAGGTWPHADRPPVLNVDQKPASTALGTWATSGFRVFLLASAAKGIDGDDQLLADIFVGHADRAFEHIGQDNELVCAASRALVGAHGPSPS